MARPRYEYRSVGRWPAEVAWRPVLDLHLTDVDQNAPSENENVTSKSHVQDVAG